MKLSRIVRDSIRPATWLNIGTTISNWYDASIILASMAITIRSR
jgi:hypothetical protein